MVEEEEHKCFSSSHDWKNNIKETLLNLKSVQTE